MMRRTGKLYTLTVASSVMATLATVMLCFWGENTGTLHLWFDVAPQGFGMASLITSTLIVSLLFFIDHNILLTHSQAMIASVTREDIAVATGSEFTALLSAKLLLTRTFSHISVQNHRTGTRGFPERCRLASSASSFLA